MSPLHCDINWWVFYIDYKYRLRHLLSTSVHILAVVHLYSCPNSLQYWVLIATQVSFYSRQWILYRVTMRFYSHHTQLAAWVLTSTVTSVVFFVSLHWLWQRAMSPADIANPAANVRPFLDRFDLYTVSFNDYNVSSSSSSSSILRVPRRLALA